MDSEPNKERDAAVGRDGRRGSCTRRYEKPSVTRIDLALEETLSKGCKLAGPCTVPITAFEAGS
jgi:hypothetical protein